MRDRKRAHHALARLAAPTAADRVEEQGLAESDHQEETVDNGEERPLRRSVFRGVLGGMFWGVVLIGGALVALNEILPPPGRSLEIEEGKPVAEDGAHPLPAGSGSAADAADSTASDAAPGGETPELGVAAATGGTDTDENAGEAPASTDETSATDAPDATDETAATDAPATADQTAPGPSAATAPEVRPIPLAGPAIEVNARDFAIPGNAGLLSVVLYGTADNPQLSEALANLSMPLTLAVGADQPGGAELARGAAVRGFEVLARLPMAAGGAGTTGLTERDGAAVLEARAAETLATLYMAVGAVAPDGAEMLTDPDAMSAILKPVAAHSFLWVEPRASSRSAAARLAVDSNLIFVQANIFLVPGSAGEEVFAGLEEAAGKARVLGTAVIFVPASPEGLRALVRWGFEKAGSDVVLAPISAIVRKRGKG